MNSDNHMLVCPTTKLGLKSMTREQAEERLGRPLHARPDLVNAKGGVSKAAGVTETVLLREDDKCAYPIVDGFPVLLAPEVLTTEDDLPFDLTDPRYAEAYEEMDFYNVAAAKMVDVIAHGGIEAVMPLEMGTTDAEKRSFPEPWDRWVDTVFDSAALWDVYSHLSPVRGKTVLQVGGTGGHAVKFSLVGASESWLVTPVVGEAAIARGLAESAGLGERYKIVVGIAEELPLKSESFDGIFMGGCLHHTVTNLAFAEAARVLRHDGKFAAVEPWRAPLYGIGTRLLGKREQAYCQPLNPERMQGFESSFSSASVIQHGTFSRYPFLALDKLGVHIPKFLPWHVGKIDDALSSIIPGLRRWGSSIAVLATK